MPIEALGILLGIGLLLPPLRQIRAKTHENGRYLTFFNRVGLLLGLGLLLQLRWLETPIEAAGLLLEIGFQIGKHGLYYR
jgi:hypothetical protein